MHPTPVTNLDILGSSKILRCLKKKKLTFVSKETFLASHMDRYTPAFDTCIRVHEIAICLTAVAILAVSDNEHESLFQRKYGLDDNTVDFIGHALALHKDDSYLDQPAMDFVKRVKLYAESLARFQGGSPYIYPLYGLGELPQAFARLSAVYGGTYMLNKPECKVEFDEDGKAFGVTSEGETAKCKKVVCDPSYLPNKVKKVGKVARAICIMSHPIQSTHDAHSVQVILPQKQVGRKSDMYLFCCSYSHNVAPKGKFIAFVTTEAETDNPEVELKPGIELLGPVDEIFFDTYDRYEPTNQHAVDNCFISTSYDATTHFESTVQDVIAMYSQITGKTLDLTVDLSAASAAAE
ncbi:hypothetical protein TEA_003967 [Camellia sinensis var. sinensis]|uniref:Guanosine nucleotide diphosphate dissociation inhibitor n=1 Tax=Camellia sinensis var. sinensis TaxID=542762 RepID=A0A4S4DDR8_CAMSN|nr:hypothetical protein TEA_003967 [Camellia sinensis var. sinensis]